MRSWWIGVLMLWTAAGLAGSAAAFPFPLSDVRGLGMGGAYVAEGTGVAAVNHNPAGLARGGVVELAVPFSVRAQDHIDMKGLLDDVDNLLGGDNLAGWFLGATQAERDRMVGILVGLGVPGKNSVDLTANAMVGVGFSGLGLALGVGYAGEVVGSMVTRIDDAHLVSDIADPAFATSGLPFNTSEIRFFGVETRQLVFSAAKGMGVISLGANLRQISGNSYFSTLGMFTNTDVDVIDLLDQTAENISGTAVDVGAQFDILPMLRGGIVGRNINSPSFDLPSGGGELTLDPRYRVGVALDFPMLVLTADMDLTTTENFSGGEFREMAVGAELGMPVLKVRAGMSRNLAMDGSPTMLHGGLGLDLAAFKLDLGVAAEPDENEMATGLSLSVVF